MTELLEKASKLAGRPVEVLKTTDGMYIVDYMRFDRPPPPKGASPEQALEFFIEHQTEYKQTEAGMLEDKLNEVEGQAPQAQT